MSCRVQLFFRCLLFPLMELQTLCRRGREPWLMPELAALLCVLLGIGNALVGCCYSAAAADAVWLGWGMLALLCFTARLLISRS